MWSIWIFCEKGHPQEGYIDDDGLVLVPDGCETCEQQYTTRPSTLRIWWEARKLRRDLSSNRVKDWEEL